MGMGYMSERIARLVVRGLIPINVIGLMFPETVVISAIALIMNIIESFR